MPWNNITVMTFSSRLCCCHFCKTSMTEQAKSWGKVTDRMWKPLLLTCLVGFCGYEHTTYFWFRKKSPNFRYWHFLWITCNMSLNKDIVYTWQVSINRYCHFFWFFKGSKFISYVKLCKMFPSFWWNLNLKWIECGMPCQWWNSFYPKPL